MHTWPSDAAYTGRLPELLGCPISAFECMAVSGNRHSMMQQSPGSLDSHLALVHQEHVRKHSALSKALCSADTDVCWGLHTIYMVMMDPVIAADGHTYERTAIQHWLQGSSLSPVTGNKLPHTGLVPNVLVKSALAQHAQASSCGRSCGCPLQLPP